MACDLRGNGGKLFAEGTSRNTLEEILEQARRLPKEEQQLVADLQADQSASPSEARLQKAMRRWLARASTGHADVAVISSRENE